MDQPLQNANTDDQTADEIRDRLVGSRQTQFVPSTEGSSDPTAAPPDYIASELGRHGAHLKLLHEVLGETYRGWKQLDSDVDAIDDKTARAFRALQAKTDRRFCDLQSSIAVTQSSLASLQSTVSQLVNDRLNDRYADTVVLDSQSWADTAKSAATSLAKTAACAIAIPIAASAAGSAFEVGRWITRDRLNQVSA